jgi:septal ring factor EnvC (AmiA/AmiB activator)
MEQIIMKQAYGDIVRLIAERDEMHRELRKAETECSMLRIECGVLEKNAEMTYENHQRIVKELTAERDEARQEVCRNEANHLPTMADPRREAARRGWDCFKKEEQNEALDRIAQFDQENGFL